MVLNSSQLRSQTDSSHLQQKRSVSLNNPSSDIDSNPSRSRNKGPIAEKVNQQTNFFVYHNTFTAPNAQIEFVGNQGSSLPHGLSSTKQNMMPNKGMVGGIHPRNTKSNSVGKLKTNPTGSKEETTNKSLISYFAQN